jgi:hypothetical protein
MDSETHKEQKVEIYEEVIFGGEVYTTHKVDAEKVNLVSYARGQVTIRKASMGYDVVKREFYSLAEVKAYIKHCKVRKEIINLLAEVEELGKEVIDHDVNASSGVMALYAGRLARASKKYSDYYDVPEWNV